MNRSIRRKKIMDITRRVMKGREVALAKKQLGFGIIVTNLLAVVVFWRWTWTLYDKRGKQ